MIDDKALTDAVIEGNVAEVMRVVKAGADINKKDIIGRSPLWWAVAKGKLDVIRMLHKLDADMETRQGVSSDSVIHIASRYGQARAISLLIELGLDVNTVNRDLKTALHTAAYNGDLGAVDALIAGGVDCSMLDEGGESAFDIAQKWMHTTVARHIKAAMDSM